MKNCACSCEAGGGSCECEINELSDDQIAERIADIAVATELAQRLFTASAAGERFIKALNPNPGAEPEPELDEERQELQAKLERLQEERQRLLRILCSRHPDSPHCSALAAEQDREIEDALDEVEDEHRKTAVAVHNHERQDGRRCQHCGKSHRGICELAKMRQQKSWAGELAVVGRRPRWSDDYMNFSGKLLRRSKVRIPVLNTRTGVAYATKLD